MQIRKIKKRSGGTRTVVCPTAEEKVALRQHIGALVAKCHSESAEGFLPGHSPITNALRHVSHAYTLSFDLSDYFDSITAEKMAGKLSQQEMAACMIDPGDGKRRACQGLPTSPAISNIAGMDIDAAIRKLLARRRLNVVYTRYADDLTFSFDDYAATAILRAQIPEIVSRCGYKINARKTRLQDARFGRREITGVSVGDDVRVPRRIRRRLRAAKHQAAHGHTARGRWYSAARARGLGEWAKMKLPKPPQTIEDQQTASERARVASTLARHWGIRCPSAIPAAVGGEVAEGDFIMTRDPAYVLGMSTYTTGWTSCMAQPRGQYRQQVGLWAGLAGTSVAALLSQHEMTHAGITRRKMRARCLVHTFRDGSRGYDRAYGDSASIALLQTWLRTRGILSVSQIRPHARVVGNVAVEECWNCWFDSLTARQMRDGGRSVWVVEAK
jgi:RNA-directed DNA polymerase